MIQVVAFLVGYILQDITLALKIGLAGTALTFLIAVPPWPFYNRNPVKWLQVNSGTVPPQNLIIDEKSFR